MQKNISKGLFDFWHLTKNTKDEFDAEMKEARAEILRIEERKKSFYKMRESIEKAAKQPSTSKRLKQLKNKASNVL